jgi:hypothetical protein
MNNPKLLESAFLIPPINSDTPLEPHTLTSGKVVLVKREDLQGDGVLLPRWGKLLGLKAVLEALPSDPSFYWFSLKGSLAIFGLDALAPLRRGPVTAFYTTKKPPIVPKHLTLRPLRANVLPIVLGQVRKLATQEGALLLPYGLAHEAHYQVSAERASLVDTRSSTVVVTCGTGATLRGLLRGFATSTKVVAVCLASRKSIERELGGDARVTYVELPKTRVEAPPAPFPSHPLWDARGWAWLEAHHELLPDRPIIFWNLGA